MCVRLVLSVAHGRIRPVASIDWDRLSQPEFDRRVEAFYKHANADLEGDAYAVDGRGGDGGVDIHIRRDGRLKVIQLKYFPEGFSNGFHTRRRQIEKSFKTAIKHNPHTWELVVPRNLTPQERHFVTALGKGKGVKISIVSRDDLDRMAADAPSLVHYFERDQIVDAARILGQEQALLQTSTDLAERAAALGARADTLDPDWGLDFSVKNGIVTQVLFAKHPDAAKRSPVEITFAVRLGPNHADLQAQLDRLTGYGTPESISIPAEVLASFVIDGPKFLKKDAKDAQAGDLLFVPVANQGAGHTFRLEFTNETGRSTGVFVGKTTWIGSASKGSSVRASVGDVVLVEFLLPLGGGDGHLSVEFDAAGKEPVAVARGIQFLKLLESPGNLKLSLNGDSVGELSPAGSPFERPLVDAGMEALKHLADDLVVVQRETNAHFGFPEAPDLDDAIHIRCLRLMLQGYCVVLPWMNRLTPALNGVDAEVLRSVLGRECSAFIVEHEESGMRIWGHDLLMGRMKIYAPKVIISNRAEALERLDSGKADGFQLSIDADPEYGFWAFLPDRFRPSADDRVRPVPLKFPGFEESPCVDDSAVFSATSPEASTRSHSWPDK